MATLGSVFVGSWYAMSGGKKADQGPPINAKSKDEESFIKDFLKKSEEKKEAH
ncbi:hypothetical protein K432DRAFT_384357 [Lepidopterella palustris CBS 459.81]|uniref:ATP synthase subunit K, mitochondrial n=1 Tax=Lepidopterella palustris CBS 459.81 TaxID=1314670 RepID=A0A8E2JCU1_9PEZI|nr:hypothetical protein K432DRAFT_384357 [Lepidopterella palustris CBS 459.81]